MILTSPTSVPKHPSGVREEKSTTSLGHLELVETIRFGELSKVFPGGAGGGDVFVGEAKNYGTPLDIQLPAEVRFFLVCCEIGGVLHPKISLHIKRWLNFV